MLLIRRKKSKGKYQNGSLTSSDTPKKLVQKAHILTLYNSMVSHSEELRILHLRSISILEYTRGGRWRPACFLNLLIGRSGIVSSAGGGGALFKNNKI